MFPRPARSVKEEIGHGGDRNLYAHVYYFVGTTLGSSRMDRGAAQRAVIKSVGDVFVAFCLFTSS